MYKKLLKLALIVLSLSSCNTASKLQENTNVNNARFQS